MARAGFWAIGGYRISFRTDGHWYADDEVIGNEKIALLFSKHVMPDREAEHADGDPQWVIDLGIDRQPVEIEDTALVVRSVEGSPKAGFRVTTNDDVTDELDCSTLRAGADNVLYCDVDRGERGTITARFLRPAYYELAAWVEESDDDLVLACRGRRFHIMTADAR